MYKIVNIVEFIVTQYAVCIATHPFVNKVFLSCFNDYKNPFFFFKSSNNKTGTQYICILT